MISGESFKANSLSVHPRGDAIQRILAAAVNSVDPAEAIRRVIHREEGTLLLHGERLDLTAFKNIYLLGIGKASVVMSFTLAEGIGDRLTAGLVVCKHLTQSNTQPGFPARVRMLEGGHPIPDKRSLQAGLDVIQFLSQLTEADLLFCLVSGGGSALVTAPVEGVSLGDIHELTTTMLACGADITEINSLRRKLDRVKGGGMARLANGARVISLILSDVVGNPLEAIASGPTVPDPGRAEGIVAILDKYRLAGRIPDSIRQALELDGGALIPGDQRFDRVENILVGSNLVAAQGALKQAEQEGFHPYLVRTNQVGEAREAAFELATFLRQAKKTCAPVPPPACLIAGGETTVTVTGSGKGGRNTELALAAAIELGNFPGVMLVTLATDGEDGSNDAAGAVVTGDTYRRARELGMHPGEYLGRNDSYTFFEALGDLLKPGPTGTNVNDLTFLFTW